MEKTEAIAMPQPDLGNRGPEEEKEARDLLNKLAEGGRKMTPEDYRAQRRSYALAAAKTPEERAELAKRYDRVYGV